ncbi:MAG TPA: enoyl-CoA hydratase/isomerase family protein [Acidimicrobiales bacterium]|nr:enoyl-CoA hydratase/isomerase family protein [Acidimicrobiales bacterium]
MGTRGREPAITTYDTLLYEEREGVAIVTLNRPEVHNAFNLEMQEELRSVWRSLRRNREIRCVVWTGAGDEAFCTGIDRSEAIDTYLADPGNPHGTGRVTTPFMFDDPGRNILPKANDLWKPVVAAVNGMACAGALYMLGESDIVIAAEHATFFDPHVTYGMVAGFEGTHLLQKLPLGETLRLVLLGAHERMTAQRAHQVGLVSEVVPADQLMDRAMWVASTIASAPVLAIQGTLRSVWMAHETSRREALAQVSALVSLGTQYENIEAGQQLFLGERDEFRLR